MWWFMSGLVAIGVFLSIWERSCGSGLIVFGMMWLLQSAYNDNYRLRGGPRRCDGCGLE